MRVKLSALGPSRKPLVDAQMRRIGLCLGSSIGRAVVSKTTGCRFKSCPIRVTHPPHPADNGRVVVHRDKAGLKVMGQFPV